MPEPTSSKKKDLMPASKLRKTLRAAGHHLSPVVQVGKGGVTPPVLRQLERALLDHELVKVKVGTESPEDRFEAAERLASESGAQLAQILGRTLLFYKKHPEKPKFEAPPARPNAAQAKTPSARPARAGRSTPRSS